MTLVEEVEVKLRDAILTGEYKAGERLIEADLAQKYQVSRPGQLWVILVSRKDNHSARLDLLSVLME